MLKLVVITDPTLSPGFRLAGVDVQTAGTTEEARRMLLALMDEGETGVVAVNADYLAALDEPTRRRIDASYKPVVVGLPSAAAAARAERRTRHLAELIRRAIGLRITFRAEHA